MLKELWYLGSEIMWAGTSSRIERKEFTEDSRGELVSLFTF
jgi:hypothetical protein